MMFQEKLSKVANLSECPILECSPCETCKSTVNICSVRYPRREFEVFKIFCVNRKEKQQVRKIISVESKEKLV